MLYDKSIISERIYMKFYTYIPHCITNPYAKFQSDRFKTVSVEKDSIDSSLIQPSFALKTQGDIEISVNKTSEFVA